MFLDNAVNENQSLLVNMRGYGYNIALYMCKNRS